MGNMTDLNERFEAHVFKHEQERIVQRWRVIRCQFVTSFFANGIIPRKYDLSR